MKRMALVVLGLMLMASGAAGFPPEFKGLSDLREVLDEISLLNLMRGLYLSADQVKQLADLAKKAEEERQLIDQGFARDRAQLMPVFETLRDRLYEAPGNERAAQGPAMQLERRVMEEFKATMGRIKQLEEEAAGVFSSSQLEIVNGFEPCLVPPPDFKNPTRVGQADGADGLMGKLAEIVRHAPDALWKERGGHFLEKILEKLEERAGEMNPNLRSDMKGRMEKTMQAIRSCSEVDYPLQREKLVGELMLINPGKHPGRPHPGKVGRFFLSAIALKVYPKWQAAAQSGAADAVAGEAGEPFGPPGWKDRERQLIGVLWETYKRRQGGASLPDWQTLVEPIIQAAQKQDNQGFLTGALRAVEKLNAVAPGPDLKEHLKHLCMMTIHATGLPLADKEEERDLLGIGGDIQKALAEKDLAVSTRKLADLAGQLLQFPLVQE